MSVIDKIRETINSNLNPDSIFAVLKKEHRDVAELMKAVEDAAAPARRPALFEQVYRALHPHSKGEEDVLYPRLEREPTTHELTLEAVEEHAVIADLLADLRTATAHGEEWMAKFKVLRENVEHHVKEEENGIFPAANAALSAAELTALAKGYGAAKARHAAADDRSQPARGSNGKAKAAPMQPTGGPSTKAKPAPKKPGSAASNAGPTAK